MAKKLFVLAILSFFMVGAVAAYASDTVQPTAPQPEKTKDRLSRGVNNIFYGPTEIPNNMSQTQTKGTKVEQCTEKTRSGVERGLARIFAGVWQVATFWYSDPGCVTSSKAPATAAATK